MPDLTPRFHVLLFFLLSCFSLMRHSALDNINNYHQTSGHMLHNLNNNNNNKNNNQLQKSLDDSISQTDYLITIYSSTTTKPCLYFCKSLYSFCALIIIGLNHV
jgi:hypothetical protein